MIQWWWLPLISLAFLGVGIFVGMRFVTSAVKTGLTDVNSPIRQMLDEFIDHQACQDAEVYAKGAELYDAQSQCLLRCGHMIAEMFRVTEKRKVMKAGPPSEGKA